VWSDEIIAFSDPAIASQKLPTIVVNADYMINMAILKRHNDIAAVTLCAKNHFGSIPSPSALHSKSKENEWDFNTYDPKVDLMGHKDLGSKTLLFIIEGLYGGFYYDSSPVLQYYPVSCF